MTEKFVFNDFNLKKKQRRFVSQEIRCPIQTKFRLMHVTSIEGVDDMILLGDLKESAILHNLHMRYKQDHIYVIQLNYENHFDFLRHSSDFFRHSPVRFLLLSIPIRFFRFIKVILFANIRIEKQANYLRIYLRLVTMRFGV